MAASDSTDWRRFWSHRISRSELRRGDHIYSWRAAFTFAHHGIYISDDRVIHFVRSAAGESGRRTEEPIEQLLVSSMPVKTSRASTCDVCRHRQQAGAGVVVTCLDCFLDAGELYRFDYGVSPAFFATRLRGGTCSVAAADDGNTAVYRAEYLLATDGFGVYSLSKNNCEDFAVYCKTGLRVDPASGGGGQSGQVASAVAAVSAMARTVPVSNGAVMAVMAAGTYVYSRYVNDVGVRSDVVKVPVERLVEMMGCSAGAAAAPEVIS